MVASYKRGLRIFQEIRKYQNTPILDQFYEIDCSQEILAIVKKQQFLLFILPSEKGWGGYDQKICSNHAKNHAMTPSKSKADLSTKL